MSKKYGIHALTGALLKEVGAIIGWGESDQCYGKVNPKGWASIFGMVWREGDDGQPEYLYDQPLIIENEGVIVVLRHEDGQRLLFSEVFRPIGERIAILRFKKYVRKLEARNWWPALFGSLGRWQFECPMGLIESEDLEGHDGDIQQIVIAAAVREARAEVGAEITNARIVGRLTPTTTFIPHASWVVEATVTSLQGQVPEKEELVRPPQWVNRSQLSQLSMEGAIWDARTIAALSFAGIPMGCSWESTIPT